MSPETCLNQLQEDQAVNAFVSKLSHQTSALSDHQLQSSSTNDWAPARTNLSSTSATGDGHDGSAACWVTQLPERDQVGGDQTPGAAVAATWG